MTVLAPSAARIVVLTPVTGILLIGLPSPAWAIPSPELVVGTLSSLSQVAALFSAILGGGAVAAGTRSLGGSGGASSAIRLALGFGVLLLLSLILNAMLYDASVNDKTRRLEATLQRPTPKTSDGKPLDPTLKEVGFAEQKGHPLSFETKDAIEIVNGIAAGTRTDWQIIDIRETAETESGSFQNALKIRFPDLPQSTADLKSKKSIFICHNGNRSAETCVKLAAQGIDCRFIAGGLEKWLTEGLPLDGLSARSIDELRAIPDYPNHQTLLDTTEVETLVNDSGAIFIDVRYPGEFAHHHLPDAISLPLRPTPSAEIAKRLSDLPRRPIIAPCYDRRSCFFGEILGLELSRAGHDYRGRYTVPWEYFKPGKRPPHVEAFLAEANLTAWQRTARAVTNVLDLMAKSLGLPLALLCLAFIARLIILPFSLKSDRDQIVAKTLAPEIAAMKQRFANDPRRLSRAMRALYKQHRLTPGRNLIALLFLPVLALSVDAAAAVASKQPSSFYWISDLQQRDASFILPVIFALLIGIYLHWATATTLRQRKFCWIIVTPLLAIAAALLPAAADIYLIASAMLLLLQRAVVSMDWRALGQPFTNIRDQLVRSHLQHPGLVPLSAPQDLQSGGNKALRLARMKKAGLPVPNGIVLTAEFLSDYESQDPDWQKSALKRIARTLGGQRFAVRSSGRAEDGAQQSYAGAFESVLDVSRENLTTAVDTVLASFTSTKAVSYAQRAAMTPDERNIVIQRMVPARYSGVLFTEDPESPGTILVEAVDGTAEKLVSGLAAPQAHRFGKLTGQRYGSDEPAIDFSALIELAAAIERQFGAPQDIEWAYASGRFLILQSRDITARTGSPESHHGYDEWRQLVQLCSTSPTIRPALEQDEMAEMLPRPTPLSKSLLDHMWAGGGSVDLAARTLGLELGEGTPERTLYVTAFGALFKDTHEEALRAPKISKLALKRICKTGFQIEHDFRTRISPDILARTQLLNAAELQRLSDDELRSAFQNLLNQFITSTHAEVSRINICASAFLGLARLELQKTGGDPASTLASTAQTELHQALRIAATLPHAAVMPHLHREIGHRAMLDYELAEPRCEESVADLERLANGLYSSMPAGVQSPDPSIATQPKRWRREKIDIANLARRFQTLKDDAKHVSLREIASLRRFALETGRRYGIGDGVFYLSFEDVFALNHTTAAESLAKAESRYQKLEIFKTAPHLAPRLTCTDIELGPLSQKLGSAAGGELMGTRVSGAGAAEGRAIVISHRDAEAGLPIADLHDGDIIVAPMIHPAWLPQVMRAGGVVSTIGGWLSHMSIVAREHSIPMIIGVTGLNQIRTGMRLMLHSDGKVEIIDEQPAANLPWPVTAQCNNSCITSTTGSAASIAYAAELPQFEANRTCIIAVQPLTSDLVSQGNHNL